MCKNLFSPRDMLSIIFLLFFRTHHFFLYRGHTHNKEPETISTKYKIVSYSSQMFSASFQPRTSFSCHIQNSFTSFCSSKINSGPMSRKPTLNGKLTETVHNTIHRATIVITGNTDSFKRLGQFLNTVPTPTNIKNVPKIRIRSQSPNSESGSNFNALCSRIRIGTEIFLNRAVQKILQELISNRQINFTKPRVGGPSFTEGNDGRIWPKHKPPSLKKYSVYFRLTSTGQFDEKNTMSSMACPAKRLSE